MSGRVCLWSALRPQARESSTAAAFSSPSPSLRRNIISRSSPKSRRRHATTSGPVSEPSRDSLPEPVPPAPSMTRLDALRASEPKTFSSFLTDTFNRQHDYLRISITEKCNLRCLYCMPEEGVPLSPKKHLLTPHEILYLSSLFVSQGVCKIRLTGGEPTVHPNILQILRDIGSLRSKGLKELALTTNGLTLHRKLDSMVESGVTGINLSLDTLDPFQFEIMTRRRGFEQVMKSIDRILDMKRLGARIKLKINAVVIRGLNDAQIMSFVDMTRNKDIEVRFIEYMPFEGNRWSSQKMLSYHEMLAIIRQQYPDVQKIEGHPNDTSKTFQVPGFRGQIGFITSMTEHFCGSCNRLRITSDGNLKVCLFGNAEVSLRDMLRASFNAGEPIDQQAWEAIRQLEMDRYEGRSHGELGLQDKELELLEVIGAAVKRKKAQHAGMEDLKDMKNRPMILIDSPSLLAPTNDEHSWRPKFRAASTSAYAVPNPALNQRKRSLTPSPLFALLSTSTVPAPSMIRAFSTRSQSQDKHPDFALLRTIANENRTIRRTQSSSSTRDPWDSDTRRETQDGHLEGRQTKTPAKLIRRHEGIRVPKISRTGSDPRPEELKREKSKKSSISEPAPPRTTPVLRKTVPDEVDDWPDDPPETLFASVSGTGPKASTRSPPPQGDVISAARITPGRAETQAQQQHLTHVNSQGEARMVRLPTPDVKPATSRTATAVSTVVFSNPLAYREITQSGAGDASSPTDLASAVRDFLDGRRSLKELERLVNSPAVDTKEQAPPRRHKGDVLAVARVAGIQAAKETSRLIPLCHNIPLAGVVVGIEVVQPDESKHVHGALSISATITCHNQTGVEMEALVAASVAGLTVYDMCKAVDRGMRIEGIRVTKKEGGRSGNWRLGEGGDFTNEPARD